MTMVDYAEVYKLRNILDEAARTGGRVSYDITLDAFSVSSKSSETLFREVWAERNALRLEVLTLLSERVKLKLMAPELPLDLSL